MARRSDSWRPITAAELEQIVEDDLTECSPAERTFFAAHRVPFYAVPIRRHGNLESALVVAHFGARVL